MSDAVPAAVGAHSDPQPQAPRLRVCVMGDELAAGVGDDQGLGWVGRLATRTMTSPPSEFYTLAVPGETVAGLAERWLEEADRRFKRGHDNRLVLALGRGDVAHGTTAMRARLNLANCLDAAVRRKVPTIVVGPPPLASLADRELAQINNVYADVTARRGLTYVDMFNSLLGDDRWRQDVIGSGGDLPGHIGYGLMAWLVLNAGWHDWLGLEPVTG